jgi:hypothetical protein
MGISNPPSARIVTPDAPVNDVKNAHTITAAQPAKPRAEERHEPFRRAAFREEITRKREQRNARQRGICGEPVMIRGNGRERFAAGPEQNHRRATQDAEDGRAANRCGQQRDEQRPAELFRRHRRPPRRGQHRARQHERHDPSPPDFIRVPQQAHGDDDEADDEERLDRPDRNAVAEQLVEAAAGGHEVERRFSEADGDNGGEGVTE